MSDFRIDTGKVEDAFWIAEEALQTVLPGSTYHSRYENIKSVGLALVSDYDFKFPPNGPFGYPDALGQTVPPMVQLDNSELHPEAWDEEGVEIDYPALLGGEKPAEMGRFEVFALAKAGVLAHNLFSSSSFRVELQQGEGRVGYAGGVWKGCIVLAVSGLWEVHDHIVAKRILDQSTSGMDLPSVDTTVEELHGEFAYCKIKQRRIPAEDLTRTEIGELIEKLV